MPIIDTIREQNVLASLASLEDFEKRTWGMILQLEKNGPDWHETLGFLLSLVPCDPYESDR